MSWEHSARASEAFKVISRPHRGSGGRGSGGMGLLCGCGLLFRLLGVPGATLGFAQRADRRVPVNLLMTRQAGLHRRRLLPDWRPLWRWGRLGGGRRWRRRRLWRQQMAGESRGGRQGVRHEVRRGGDNRTIVQAPYGCWLQKLAQRRRFGRSQAQDRTLVSFVKPKSKKFKSLKQFERSFRHTTQIIK